MNDIPFWQSKIPDDMTDASGNRCVILLRAVRCLHKLMDEDSDEIHFTNVACKQRNIKTCQVPQI